MEEVVPRCGLLLGVVPFLQRITKALFEEHSECLYWFDTQAGDLERVKNQIAEGNLGESPKEKWTERAKQYRTIVRVWSYSQETIQRKMTDWNNLFRGDHDETIAADLFTSETEKAVVEQISNAKRALIQ